MSATTKSGSICVCSMEKRPHGADVAMPTLPVVTLVSKEKRVFSVVDAANANALTVVFLIDEVAVFS